MSNEDKWYISGPLGIGTTDPSKGNLVVDGGKLAVNPGSLTSWPAGWGDGVHTWDLYGEGTVGAGKDGKVNTYLSRDGNGLFSGSVGIGTEDFTKGKLVIDGGKLAVNSRSLTAWPTGWGDGIHTWDLYGEGTVGTGKDGNVNAYLNRDGHGYFSGKVGIGTSDPKAQLHVNGDALLTGNLTFSNTSPNSNVGFSNVLTSKNIIKAWGVIRTNLGSPNVLDGFNIASVTIDASNEATITLASGLTNPVVCMAGNSHSDESFIRLKWISEKVILAKGWHRTGGVQGWKTADFVFSFMLIGA